ncbi:MAG: oxidoreductase [Pseudomonadota bacterium]
MPTTATLFDPVRLPCGVMLKNRIVKSAMSDSLGDGTGHPTAAQIRLYQRWAHGGVAASIVGEVQSSGDCAEKPGNLVLNAASEAGRFEALARVGLENEGQLWVQLGHAGALAHPPISRPKGPSRLDLPGLTCAALSHAEIEALPAAFADTARHAQIAGFGGVQVHSAHGFLLSQFLSPLFNHRNDAFGGTIANRMRLLLNVVAAVRVAVGPEFPVAVKLNSSDMLEGGLVEEDALEVIAMLDRSPVDLVEISGGTYFPGAANASDAAVSGPYFLDFARRARAITQKPLMLTGGFKTRAQAEDVLTSGTVDIVGLARALVLEPELPLHWLADRLPEPVFPRFSATPPEGGISAWYTMRLTELGEDRAIAASDEPAAALTEYLRRDEDRADIWRTHFAKAD